MDSNIKKIFEDIVKIEEIEDYLFRKSCGFTFVFKRQIITFNGRISSGEIKPIAIIYEENGEYYLAPIDVVDEIEEVMKQFVKKILR